MLTVKRIQAEEFLRISLISTVLEKLFIWKYSENLAEHDAFFRFKKSSKGRKLCVKLFLPADKNLNGH